MKKYFNKKWCDRYDGWRVNNVDPLMLMVPFFMRSRSDSQVAYNQIVDLEPVEKFTKSLRDKYPNISIPVIVAAALVRLLAYRPHLNRFVIHNKLYARKFIKFSLAVKESLTDDAPENMAIIEFEPEDTLDDVIRKITKAVSENKVSDVGTGTSKAISILKNLPSGIFRLFVNFIFCVDKHGGLPKFLVNISPWHSSAFITNMGSIGIDSVYHHLYEFGTSSFFVSIGKKNKNYVMNAEEELVAKRSIEFKFVIDERVCDGFYYAKSMRLLTKILNNPEQLLLPPDEVIVDEGVARERIA